MTYEPMNSNMKDVTGTTGAELLNKCLMKTYVHAKTQKRYLVLSFTWLADTDTWGISHREVNDEGEIIGGSITRSHTEFFGTHANGQPRYTLVS